MTTVDVIEPAKPQVGRQIFAVWRFRHLFFFFTRNSIRGYYANTILGWPWLVIRPLLPALLFAVLFSNVQQFKGNGLPYLLFLLSGFALWNLVGVGLRISVRSISGHRKFITRMNFPHMIVPLATIAPAFAQFLFAMVVMGLATAYYWWADGKLYIHVSWRLLWLPGPVLITLLTVGGIGMLLSGLNAFARDVRLTLPLFLQFWMFVSPVLYPLTVVPEHALKIIYIVNPMASVLDTFKWILFDIPMHEPTFVWYAAGMSLVIFGIGAWFLTRLENALVDYL
ncbi:lipopolysaccharide transport system permease protein [Tistlia consotensis]|uniref:Transport permease protein n=1 Tax=Tistlia consotensis USBA 355 TaxID=560819 RepID=A0A1Y6BDK7_9PROT|nr:ABC transporter permease [Tistlia consotensis]SME99128.1 lipopolysaccharide transport system permease protein [Tistlia consotensis USBA 355]SNR77338.1 lipopolysaccharide transport system permease protein [Tistlia consotensis]